VFGKMRSILVSGNRWVLRMTFDDYFWKRMFSAMYIKRRNVY